MWSNETKGVNPASGRHLKSLWNLIMVQVMVLVIVVIMAGLLSEEARAGPEDTEPPVADAGVDQLVNHTGPAAFDGSGSTDNVGVVEWSWSFRYQGGPVVLHGPIAYFPFKVRGEYLVTLMVRDLAGNSDTDELSVTVITPPSNVTDLIVIPRSNIVELKWGPPTDDGGSNVTSGIVYRGSTPNNLTPLTSDFWIGYTAFDLFVQNGLKYYYAVAAVNAVGIGPISHVVNATPMGVPDRPNDLVVEVLSGAIRIEWAPPNASHGRVPVTGYQVHRGIEPDWLYDIFEVDNATSYIDKDVEMGVTYYYAVGAKSELGSGDVTPVEEVTLELEDEGVDPWDLFPLLAVVAICGTAVAVAWMVTKPREKA